ncbi:MAG: MarC family protein [Elainella sp. Prado103]|jgi:multiple antibiotic resistance protein|nr:MarC family protein [Elainella sp. Prado103]
MTLNFAQKRWWISAIASLILVLGLNVSQPRITDSLPICTKGSEQLACQQNSASRLLLAQAPAPPASAEPAVPPKQQIADQIARMSINSPIGIFNLFIIFFVTLGPLKTIPSFVQLTQNADAKLRQQLAFRSTAIATIVILLVTMVGQNMLRVWQVHLPALLIAGGILLFMVALKIVLSEYNPPEKTPPPDEPSLKMAVTPLAFPTIVPPFGIAIALTIMAISQEINVSATIVLGLLVLVMLLNLLGMLAARPILMFLKPVTLRILGFALGVLQLAMGVEWIIAGLEIEVLVLRRLLQS